MKLGVSNDAIDAALTFVADRADALVLCDGPPADGAAAMRTVSDGGCGLGAVAMSTGVGGGDYAVDDGDVPGRKLTIAAQHAIPVSTTGLASHLALVETRAQRLLLTTRLAAPIAVVEGAAVGVEGFDHEIQDPTDARV